VALDAATLDAIREWVGSTPDDTTVESTYQRTGVGTVERAALAILRKRRADMVASPAEWDLTGDYSQKTGKNLDELDKLIAALEGITGAAGAGTMTTSQLVRPDRAR
jgi:hypothetical protein